MALNRLKGKVAIVTGGAKGLGYTFSHALAAEGAKVVVCGAHTPCEPVAEEIKKKGGDAIGFKVDVTKEEDTQMMAKKVVEKFGRIDILVNNAAIFGGLKLTPFLDVDTALWRKVIDTNITGMFLCCKAVIPQMIKQKKGNIVNISSTIWLYPKIPLIHYITTKAAEIGFTRCLAGDPTTNQNGIRVNALMPGGTWDEATIGILGGIPGVEEQLLREQNIHRREMPEDLVGPLIFLCSDESAIMSGNALAADAGLAVW
ncbi:MAG: SDR family NAD(P)-dependent oxidoreductase [Proteobacteria bacterium]|nr:SDR family NAD(P)-dependent oxidoreductase [Pseudomonadota bacterium]